MGPPAWVSSRRVAMCLCKETSISHQSHPNLARRYMRGRRLITFLPRYGLLCILYNIWMNTTKQSMRQQETRKHVAKHSAAKPIICWTCAALALNQQNEDFNASQNDYKTMPTKNKACQSFALSSAEKIPNCYWKSSHGRCKVSKFEAWRYVKMNKRRINPPPNVHSQ